MAVQRKVGNLLGLVVLAYLVRGPMHPYELSRMIRDNGDARSVKFAHGSLYMVVQQLERAGFVVEHGTSRAGQRPERTRYALTDAGRTELRDWLRELIEQPRHEYPHFVAALSLIAALPPDEVVSLLRGRLHRLTEQVDEIRQLIDTTLAADVHPLFLVEEEYRLAMLRAESAFVERFIERVTDPDTGWERPWAAFHATAGSPTEGDTDD